MRIYLRAHCCREVASSAQVRLITRLKNQSELNQMADMGGLKVNGLGGGEGREIVCDPLETTKIWAIVAR